MGFLNDLGLGGIEVNPELPEGTYKGHVFASKEQMRQRDGKRMWVLTYKVDQPGTPFHHMTKDEWKNIDKSSTEDEKRFLKMRVLSLGVPEDRIDAVNFGDFEGIPVFFTLKRKGEYVNVVDVKLNPEASAAVAGQAPYAPTQPATGSGNGSGTNAMGLL